MLLTVHDYLRRVRTDLPGLVRELQEETLRFGDEEREAWLRSLPPLATALDQPALQSFHLHLGDRGQLSLEYRLPGSSSWCDVVLLGRDRRAPAAVILELKDWDTRHDAPGPRPGLVLHLGRPVLHPAAQVADYVEYCRRFHSAVQEQKARVHGCVFMTGPGSLDAYRARPHEELVARFPVLAFRGHGTDLADHLCRLLEQPAPDFAAAFEAGSYRQDRNFVRQVARTLEDPAAEEFVLLDGQRLGFELCLHQVQKLLGRGGDGEKAVVIVEGPPGSGKSVLAARLWAALARDERLGGNFVFTTTSSAQRSNWEALFRRVAGGPAGRGIVMPANRYNPGLSPRWVQEMRRAGERVEIGTWRRNLELYARLGGRPRLPDDSLTVSIVDEAHALIDPTAPGARGTPPSGWTIHAGPQAWHIIRASRLSVFLMDPEQSYRDNERTTPAAIEAFARDLGVRRIERVSLADAQFRCAGSREYLEWLDAFLGLRGEKETVRPAGLPPARFPVELVEDPFALEEALRRRAREGASVRLAASYARPWRTKDEDHPHDLPPERQDFRIPVSRGGEVREWVRPWNHAPGQDYSLFVLAAAGSRMAADPLAEVGCPYVLRGFDYDWLGVLWLNDLVWRDGAWRVQLEHVHETAWRKTLAAARREGGRGPHSRELLRKVLRGYRILFTRAMRGLYVWVEDPETREHLRRSLAGSG